MVIASKAALERFNTCYMDQRLNHVFKKLDQNRDGKIDPSDLARYFKFLKHKPRPNEIQDTIWEVDLSGCGKLNWTEFKAMRDRVAKDKTFREPRLLYNLVEFMTFDQDDSGEIDEEEIMSIFFFLHKIRGEMLDRYMKKFLDRLSTCRARSKSVAASSGHGTQIEAVSYSEYLTVMTQIVKEHRAEMTDTDPNSPLVTNRNASPPPLSFALVATAHDVDPNFPPHWDTARTAAPDAPASEYRVAGSHVLRGPHATIQQQAGVALEQPEDVGTRVVRCAADIGPSSPRCSVRPTRGKLLRRNLGKAASQLDLRSPEHVADLVPTRWWLTAQAGKKGAQTARQQPPQGRQPQGRTYCRRPHTHTSGVTGAPRLMTPRMPGAPQPLLRGGWVATSNSDSTRPLQQSARASTAKGSTRQTARSSGGQARPGQRQLATRRVVPNSDMCLPQSSISESEEVQWPTSPMTARVVRPAPAGLRERGRGARCTIQQLYGSGPV